MNAAKIRLSPKEMELVINADCILTKNSILQKTNKLLGQLQEAQYWLLLLFEDRMPSELFRSSPKISKGENYEGLPYLVLDYPKYFDRTGVIAIRTLFWWGNFFSITLQLSDRFKTAFESKIISAYSLLKKNGFSCCVNAEQWEHHFEKNNYLMLDELGKAGFEKEITGKNFLKLAKKIPLAEWDDAENILLTSFEQLITILID
jgi:hypothetical protein